jgi:DnaK suppressor protein
MSREEAYRSLLSRKAALDRRERVSTASRDVAPSEMEEITAALRRIEQGTWGRCEACQGAIGWQRLRAMPETRRCTACSLELERGQVGAG